jgi:hypothetical protein
MMPGACKALIPPVLSGAASLLKPFSCLTCQAHVEVALWCNVAWLGYACIDDLDSNAAWFVAHLLTSNVFR